MKKWKVLDKVDVSPSKWFPIKKLENRKARLFSTFRFELDKLKVLLFNFLNCNCHYLIRQLGHIRTNTHFNYRCRINKMLDFEFRRGEKRNHSRVLVSIFNEASTQKKGFIYDICN